jgi:hypothetical protein
MRNRRDLALSAQCVPAARASDRLTAETTHILVVWLRVVRAPHCGGFLRCSGCGEELAVELAGGGAGERRDKPA